MALAVADCRALVPTPLTDPQLQSVIDRVEADIDAVLGAVQDALLGTELTEIVNGGDSSIFIKRPIHSVTTVTEYASRTDVTGVALTEDEEFYVWPDEGRLERIGGSIPRSAPSALSVFHMTDAQFAGQTSGGCWGSHVEVVYKPADQHLKREQATIDLVRIYLSRTALMSESVAGEYSYQAPANWELEKRRIMRRLSFTQI